MRVSFKALMLGAAIGVVVPALPAFAQPKSKLKTQSAPQPEIKQPATTTTPSSKPVLSLKQAVEQALQYSPDLKAYEAVSEQRRFQKYVARSGLLPNVRITGVAAERRDSVANRTPGSLPFAGTSYNQYTLGIHAEQPLLAYGLFSVARQGRINEEIGRADLEIGRRSVAQDVIDAYYATVMNENLVRIFQDQERAITEILNISRRRMGFGGKRLDYLQSQTKLAVLTPKIIKAKNDLIASTARLAQLMGMENASSLTIGTGMPELAFKDVLSRFDAKGAEIPELKQQRLQREFLGEQRSIVLGKSLPSLKLTGDYGFDNYTKSELFDSPSRSWQAAVVLDIPIFSGLSVINERRAVIAQEYQTEANERSVRNQVAVAQISSRTALEAVEASLLSATEGVKISKSAMAEARQNYSVGLINFVEFSTVQDAEFDAATTLLKTRYDAIKAYSVFFASSGQSLPTLVDILNSAQVKQ